MAALEYPDFKYNTDHLEIDPETGCILEPDPTESNFAQLRTFQLEALDQLVENKICFFTASRQVGKSVLAREILKAFVLEFDGVKNPMALILANTHEQAYKLHGKFLQEAFEDYPDALMTIQGKPADGQTVTIERPWFGDYVTLYFRGVANPKSIPGLTGQLLILDEAAMVPDIVYFRDLRPIFTAYKKSLKFIISTVRGRNWFWDMLQHHSGVRYKYSDAIRDRYITQAEYDDLLEEYVEGKNYHTFLQEFECDPDAGPPGETPFTELVNRLNCENTAEYPTHPALLTVLDVGQRGSNPAWTITSEDDKTFQFVNYEKDMSNKELILHLITKFPKNYHTIYFPHDITCKSINDGLSFFEELVEFVRVKGLDRRVTLKYLDKTPPGGRKVLLDYTVQNSHRFKMGLIGCREGIDFLSQARLQKNKDGYITSDWEKKNFRHTADALLYFGAVLMNRLYNFRDENEYALRVMNPREANYYEPVDYTYNWG